MSDPAEIKHCRAADGGHFYPLAPERRGLSLQAAVHAISRICRFNGHLKKPYYVAQHCVLVSRDAEALALKASPAEPGQARRAGLEGLGHDLDEGAVGDMTTPCKAGFPEFKALEHRWEAVLNGMFWTMRPHDPRADLRDPLPYVKLADRARLAVDRRDLVGEPDWYEGRTVDELLLAVKLKAGRAWGYRRAEREWLVRFEELTGRDITHKTLWWRLCRLTDHIVGAVLG